MPNKFISEPVVEAKREQPYVAIPVQATLLEWEKVDEALEEIFKWLARKGVEPEGVPFYRYWIIGGLDEVFSLEVGVPVGRMLTGDDRVLASFIPGGSYVKAVHRGHPERLEDSFAAMEEWSEKEGLELDKRWEEECEIWNGRFEFYLTDPAEEPDPDKWMIEIAYLLMRDDAA